MFIIVIVFIFIKIRFVFIYCLWTSNVSVPTLYVISLLILLKHFVVCHFVLKGAVLKKVIVVIFIITIDNNINMWFTGVFDHALTLVFKVSALCFCAWSSKMWRSRRCCNLVCHKLHTELQNKNKGKTNIMVKIIMLEVFIW